MSIHHLATRFGRNSRQIGVLLADIGETAVRRGKLMQGADREDRLRRGITALLTGIETMGPYQPEHVGYTIQIARAYRLAGEAYLVLGEDANAEKMLRRGLAVHWRRFGDAQWQLEFFPLLFEAVITPREKLKVAESELKIARKVFNVPEGGSHFNVEQALSRIQRAKALGNPLGEWFDTTREEAMLLADTGDMSGAYEALMRGYRLAKTKADRDIFVARIKPAPFFMYDDPNASRPSESWDLYQKTLKMGPYDHVATRFLVDHGLTPFIQEGRNNLFGLLNQLGELHASGDREKTIYFCRLVPSGYTGYDLNQGDGTGIPPFCMNTLEWARWMRLQRGAGSTVRYIEMGLALLDDQNRNTPLGKKFIADSQTEMAFTEAHYGSPDSFLAAYEQLEFERAKLPPDLALYAAIIRDDPISFRRALGTRPIAPPSVDATDLPFGIESKMAAIGPAIVSDLCRTPSEKLSVLLTEAICTSGGSIEPAAVEKIRSELVNDGARTAGHSIRSTPDRRLYSLLKRREFNSMRKEIAKAFAPGIFESFQARPLTPREEHLLARSLTFEAYQRELTSQGLNVDFMVPDFNPALIANAFLAKGKLDLARSWAVTAVRHFASADSPATVFSAFLSENYDQETYQDGWRWLILGHPVLAEAAFSSHAPGDQFSYSRGAGWSDGASSLEWERVLGALQGRIIARRTMGDLTGAETDARTMVAYVNFVMGLQSFSRNETREIIARVARASLVEALDVLAASQPSSPENVDAIFQITQLMKLGGTGATVARLAARLSAVSPELAELARQREDLRLRWQQDTDDEGRKAKASKLDEIDAELLARFPAYVEMAGRNALSVKDVAQVLAEDEALIFFSDGGVDYYGGVITRKQAVVRKIDQEPGRIADLVADLRRSFDPIGGRAPSFRSDSAVSLYIQLMAPLEAALSERPKHLVLVPDGPLESLPFSVLLTNDEEYDDFASAPWLSDRYTLSRVPSVTSLFMLRSLGLATPGSQPFFGIGDPKLGPPGITRGYGLDELTTMQGGIELDNLRALPSLPDTAEELRHLQKMLDASSTALLLGADATETNLKSRPLDDFKTVAFATHGLIAGEVLGMQEPGLVLTPPATLTAADDGYLSASEIAALNFNAEIILLSACNTAAPNQVGAEGLSGLAKAFFFAGARNLLVSHWPVDSVAAATLTTQMFTLRNVDPTLSYSQALGTAMKKLRNTPEGRFAHPIFWAPFEVVGG